MTGMIEPEWSQPVTIRLVIVARQRLDGDTLSAIFLAHSEFNVLCTTTSVQVASAVGRHRPPDVVLLDAAMISQEEQGFAPLAAELGAFPILLLDDVVHNGRLGAILKQPRVGYFTRGAPFSELAAGIRSMANGERAFDLAAKSRLELTPRGWQFRREESGSYLALLTPREIEVLKLVALGHSVKRCAALLKLAPSTVDNHKARLMKKLGVHKALDRTRFAIREGLMEN